MPTITLRGQTFLALGVTTTVMGMVLGFPDITRVGVLLLLLPALALLATWRPAPRIAVARSIAPPLLAAGEPARVHLRLRNVGARRSPLYLAEEELDPRLGHDPRFILPRMQPGESHELSYDVASPVRGRHRVGPLTLRQQDPFGLTSTTVVLPSRLDVVVLPRVEALGASRPRGEAAGNEGRLPHMVALHGEDDASIRGYRDGDDLRRVHWPTTAHRGELMVRQEDRPARRRTVLVLGPGADADADPGSADAFEWAVSALASVAVHLTGLGHAVHLVCADPLREDGVEHAQGLDTVLRALAVATPQRGGFDEAVRLAHSLATNGGTVVVAAADDDDELLRQLAGIRPPGGVGLLFLLDAASFVHEDGGAPRARGTVTRDVTDLMTAAGWRTDVVTAGVSVRTAWERTTQSAGVEAVRR